VDLSKRPQIVVLTKVEGIDDTVLKKKLQELKKAVPRGTPLQAISAQSRQGINELLYTVKDVIKAEHERQAAEQPETAGLLVLRLADDDGWRVERTDEGFVVTGQKIERFAARTDFGNVHGVQRLRDIMKKMGVMKELVRQGIEPEQAVVIGKPAIGRLEY
jgi:GTP-binding protein